MTKEIFVSSELNAGTPETCDPIEILSSRIVSDAVIDHVLTKHGTVAIFADGVDSDLLLTSVNQLILEIGDGSAQGRSDPIVYGFRHEDIDEDVIGALSQGNAALLTVAYDAKTELPPAVSRLWVNFNANHTQVIIENAANQREIASTGKRTHRPIEPVNPR